jgi:hypothetical protein
MFDLQKIDENAVRCQGYPPSDLPSWEEALWHSAEDLKNGRISGAENSQKLGYPER